MADWQASQYQSWRSGEASAKQVMQHLGMGMMFESGQGTGVYVGNAV
jgi:hypothetical protein